ncbi:hypothetical protein D1953_18045 [Peribacillus asahii]|uniref:Uncharacterized protein n=1 Tax=Peribacillus asahii TaxID=228899 RepID=A0A398AY41_9BACI|nr:hypothetical protein D1953_18045 [Peribacillus asahii]
MPLNLFITASFFAISKPVKWRFLEMMKKVIIFDNKALLQKVEKQYFLKESFDFIISIKTNTYLFKTRIYELLYN